MRIEDRETKFSVATNELVRPNELASSTIIASLRRLGPSRLLVLTQCFGRKVDTPLADHRFVAHWAWPTRFIAAIHRRSILGRLQTHRTGILSRRCIRSVENNVGVGDTQALAADTTALMTLKDRHVYGPLSLTEVTKNIGHLHVVWIGAGLTHGGSINPRPMKGRNAETGQRSSLVWPRNHAAGAEVR